MLDNVYVVKNIVGDARTRTHRALSATTQLRKLFIAGFRLVPGSKLTLSESIFQKEAKKLKQYLLDGKITLILPDMTKITTAHTGEFILSRVDGAIKVLPKGELPNCFQSIKDIETDVPPVIDVPLEEVVLESEIELNQETLNSGTSEFGVSADGPRRGRRRKQW